MASFAISSSLHRACSFSNSTVKRHPLWPKRSSNSGGATCQATTAGAGHVLTQNIEGQKGLTNISEHQVNRVGEDYGEDHSKQHDSVDEGPKFRDERWKKGTWDLNMFVKNGRMDWDSVIVAEARRRRFLELYPEAATNQEPVLFRSSIVPWWAWLRRSHLPEAELLNGRAAMIGFFTAYLVDALTGLDLVGQNGNFICKTLLFLTVAGVLIFRRNQDLETLTKLADEATFYDKQWQSSWQDHSASSDPKSNKKE